MWKIHNVAFNATTSNTNNSQLSNNTGYGTADALNHFIIVREDAYYTCMYSPVAN
jgi:hypothetical protein